MIRAFDFLMDLDVLNAWLGMREIDSVGHVDLPAFGLMAYEDKQSLGCVFLRSCEGDLGMLCSFEINPSLPLRLKDKVFDELLICGREFAHLKGMKRLMAMSEKRSVIRKLEKRGWKKSSHQLISAGSIE